MSMSGNTHWNDPEEIVTLTIKLPRWIRFVRGCWLAEDHGNIYPYPQVPNVKVDESWAAQFNNIGGSRENE